MEHTRGVDTNGVEEKSSKEAEHCGSYRAASVNSYPLVGGEEARGGNRVVFFQFKCDVELGADGPVTAQIVWCSQALPDSQLMKKCIGATTQ